MTSTSSAPASGSRRPLRRRLQARFMRVVNVPMRVVLGLSAATPLSRRLMLITFTGRRTGKTYRQPLSYVEQDGTLLTPGGGKWTLNLTAGEPVRMRLRGRDVLARPEFVADPDEVERLLAQMSAANPRVRTFVGIPQDEHGRLDRDQLLTALRHGFRVVRWRLDEPAAP
jgi:deazaflavin-dependent oxidoreductase (nitroreductase family)